VTRGRPRQNDRDLGARRGGRGGLRRDGFQHAHGFKYIGERTETSNAAACMIFLRLRGECGYLGARSSGQGRRDCRGAHCGHGRFYQEQGRTFLDALDALCGNTAISRPARELRVDGGRHSDRVGRTMGASGRRRACRCVRRFAAVEDYEPEAVEPERRGRRSRCVLDVVKSFSRDGAWLAVGRRARADAEAVRLAPGPTRPGPKKNGGRASGERGRLWTARKARGESVIEVADVKLGTESTGSRSTASGSATTRAPFWPESGGTLCSYTVSAGPALKNSLSVPQKNDAHRHDEPLDGFSAAQCHAGEIRVRRRGGCASAPFRPGS
jgi:hypothetical protein